MRSLFTFLVSACFTSTIWGQTNCTKQNNSHIPNTPWPIYHANSAAQAATCLKGPQPNDSLTVMHGRTPLNRASPWLYLSETYENGQRAILGSNATHAFKANYTDEGIHLIDSLRIDYNILDYSWNFLLSNNKIWYTHDNFRGTGRILMLTDEDTTKINSPIKQLDEFNLAKNGGGRLTTMNMTYDGWIAYNTREGVFGMVKKDFSRWTSIQLPLEDDEIHYHNAFPVDTDNSMYLVTTKKMIKIGWNGESLAILWVAPYDFVKDGPRGLIAEGSGTTPTLIGEDGNDKLVVVCDGHERNNMVAFWRDEIPTDWRGIPSEHPRLAGKIQLPHAVNLANGFQSIENSPTAYGYEIACAQYNGFSPGCENQKGVQKVSWDTFANRFSIAWATNEININGVLTYSSNSGLVYGSGREADCNYYFYALDWETGALKIRYSLGNSPKYNDQGNNVLIDEFGNAIFCTEEGLLLIRSLTNDEALNPIEEQEVNEDIKEVDKIISISQNPFKTTVDLSINKYDPNSSYELTIHDIGGKLIATKTQRQKKELWDLVVLSAGMYILRATELVPNGKQQLMKIIKN